MLAIILFYLGFSIICFVILIMIIKKAPTSFENEAGFHIGNIKITKLEDKEFKDSVIEQTERHNLELPHL